MIPLIKTEILSKGWLTLGEFTDIVAISQMTPGPIAINAATFVGYRILGLWGAVVATSGVVLPSVILALTVAKALMGRREHPFVSGIFRGLRPAVVALIAAAGFLLVPDSILSLSDLLVCLLTVALVLRTRVSPLLLIVLGGLYGIGAGMI